MLWFSAGLVGGTTEGLRRLGQCASPTSFKAKEPLAPSAHPKLFPFERGKDGAILAKAETGTAEEQPVRKYTNA